MPGFSGISSAGTVSVEIKDNVVSKLGRIQGAANYTRVITYVGTTDRVNTITHTGTTEIGPETLIETITYDGSNRITNIVYS